MVKYNAVQYGAVQCSAVRCSAVQYSMVKYGVVECSALTEEREYESVLAGGAVGGKPAVDLSDLE